MFSLWKETGVSPSFERLRLALHSTSLLENQNLSQSLLQDVKSLESIKKEDLSGLKAQIQSFTGAEFKKLLSPALKVNEIDLCDVIKKSQVAYFQLNLNGYGFLGAKIGKMLVQDLKVISSQIQSGQLDFKPDFLGVFIDEFGSFAAKDFSDFLKQVRSANIGVHLFCQGLADLNNVSPDFSNQIFGNTAAKIVLRQDVAEDCEKWASTAGTMDTVSRTFQVNSSQFGEEEKTGLGSLFETKKMKIEHDVFKNLKVGQAVLIDKVQTQEDLFQIFNLKGE